MYIFYNHKYILNNKKKNSLVKYALQPFLLQLTQWRVSTTAKDIACTSVAYFSNVVHKALIAFVAVTQVGDTDLFKIFAKQQELKETLNLVWWTLYVELLE